jgi:catechol 2,3-dioxygenase-like lactoylglutathione lyase family enzyme
MGLSDFRVDPAVAVTDLAAARRFYEDRLGLRDPEPEEDGVRYPCAGGSRLFVYESSSTAGKAEHTVAAWFVDDLDALMTELEGRGVSFEQYDEGTPTDERGVFTGKLFQAAWVCDPDGNTFAFTELF